LVQWLSSRLDRSVIAPDLAKQGFRLMGGRILPGADGPAAQIMYDDDHGTRLTIYLQPMAVGLTDFRYTESDGVRTFYRAEHGVAFAVSARTDRERLRGLARVAADQLAAGPPRPSPS
jgi:anti-sigma factor RsiW